MDWSIIVSVCNDESVLNSTLLRSPLIKDGRMVVCQRNYQSVAEAYNAAISECRDDILVFTHPDVYLPKNWDVAFEKCLDWLNRNDPQWGVLGLFGTSHEGSGLGFTYSTGLRGFIGVPFAEPCQVRTLDEFLFVIRRSSGLKFDEKIPNAQSQLCTTDLCLESERRKMKSYVLPCLALHNSNRWNYLPIGFLKNYFYMRNKWRVALPIYTPYIKITIDCLPMIKNFLKGIFRANQRTHRTVTRVSDPEILYEQIKKDLISTICPLPCCESSRTDGCESGHGQY